MKPNPFLSRMVSLVLALILSLQWLASAYAGDEPLLVARWPGAENKDAGLIQAALYRRLSEILLQQAAVVDEAGSEERWRRIQKDLGADESPTEAFILDRTGTLVLEAKRQYFALQFDACLSTIARAAERQQARFSDGDKGRPFNAAVALQMALVNGLCQLAKNNETAALLAFREALRLRPNLRLDPAQYAPSVQSALESARAAQAVVPAKASLAISTVPPFAQVWINGENRGQSPLTLEDLPKGPLYLRLRSDQHGEIYRYLELSEHPTRLSLVFKPFAPWILPLPAGDLTELANKTPKVVANEPEDLEAIARTLGASALWIFQVVPQGWDFRLVLEHYDATSRRIEARAEENFVLLGDEPLRALDRALNRLEHPAAPVAVAQREMPAVENLELTPPAVVEHTTLLEKPQAETKPVQDGPAFYETWWFWTLAGVLVAGAIAGTAVAVTQGGDFSGPRGSSSSGGGAAGSGGNGVLVGFHR